jgi:hypothetical protein
VATIFQSKGYTAMNFSPANTKLKKLYKSENPAIQAYLSGKRKVYSFDLLSGHSCPFADKCLSKAVETPEGRRIQDGPNTEFRCFSASQEVVYTNVYNSRKGNFENVRFLERDEIAAIIQDSLPKNAGIIRIHVAGDFFNIKYFQAWLDVARNNTNVLFYAYTKALPFWIKCQDEIPTNVILTASYGGRCDSMIAEHNLRYSLVVNCQGEADDFSLEVDNDDSHAADPTNVNKSFALIIHGTQPKKAKKKALTNMGA